MTIKSILTQQKALSLALLLIMPSTIYASPIIINKHIDINRLCEAIRQAEGKNSKGVWTYGIINPYKHTTNKQACINSIRHRLKDFNAQGQTGDFIAYLGKYYAPIGVSNDPSGLNRNWIKNVHYFYERSTN